MIAISEALPNYRKWTREANQQAHALLSRAVELDSSYAMAMLPPVDPATRSGLCKGWTDDRQAEIAARDALDRALPRTGQERCGRAGRRGLHADPVWRRHANGRLAGRSRDQPEPELVRCTGGEHVGTDSLGRSCKPAVEHLLPLQALQLNPLNQTKTPLALGYFLLGQAEPALRCAEEALINAPKSVPALVFAAMVKVSFGQAGPKRVNCWPGSWTSGRGYKMGLAGCRLVPAKAGIQAKME